MSNADSQPGVAIVAGAGGQDGYFLTEHLLQEGWVVYATTRSAETLTFEELSADARGRLHTYEIDLLQPQGIFDLINRVQPEEFYNLAGQSSVSRSFEEPLYTWQTNAETVVHLLECVRCNSPHTRFYQASSTEMFGVATSGAMRFHEGSPLSPQSPYASAKAAAHLLCRSYREVYGLRIACGILSNHESYRRPASFLSRKVVDHAIKLAELSRDQRGDQAPLAMGNLKIRRDWGFAPDYVRGMCRILRQVGVRAQLAGRRPEEDEGRNYHDYLLATGQTHAVWELVDCAFRLAGLDLEWDLDGDEPTAWQARLRQTGTVAVKVDAALLRVAEPMVIEVDPARARRELAWAPQLGLEVIVRDMLGKLARHVAEPGSVAAIS